MKQPRIKNILVPIDFSQLSMQAIDLAKRVADRFRANLHLIHVHQFYDLPFVMPATPLGLPSEIPDWRFSTAGETKKRFLNDLQGVAAAAGLSADRCHVRSGGPAFHEICQFAKEHATDLVVMPTHGRSALEHMFLGSTAERVVQHSPCPVLVTRGHASNSRNGKLESINRILVPVDLSECSLGGLRYAIRLAREFAASIVVLHVLDLALAFTADGYVMYDLARYENIAKQEAEKELNRFLRRVKFGGVTFKTRVVVGLFLDALNDTIRQCNIDLLVTPTHGRTGLKHFVLGSTAELMVRRAGCPVLVVPSYPAIRVKTLATVRSRFESRTGPSRGPRHSSSSVMSEPLTKRFRKLTRHPLPERRKTNKFRETHQLVKK